MRIVQWMDVQRFSIALAIAGIALACDDGTEEPIDSGSREVDAGPMRDAGSDPVDSGQTRENPYGAVRLIELAEALEEATDGMGTPTSTPLALVGQRVVPFYIPTQIGAGRAASEIGCPFAFNSPLQEPDDTADTLTAKQEAILNDLIDQGYAGIAVSVRSPSMQMGTLERATTAGLELITFDSDAADSGRFIYMGTDNREAGRVIGRSLVELLPEGGTFISMTSNYTQANMVERHEGLLEAVEDAGVTEATFLPDNLSREAAQANLRIALAEHPDVAALVGLSSSTGPAAADILVEMGRDDIHVVAMDATAPTQEYLATGLIDVMVAQRPYYWGYLGLYIMYAMRTLGDDATRTLLEPWLSGEDMDILDTGTDVVRPADLEFYLEYLESIGISAS